MSNQKPFDPTKPVQTRDGRPARIVATLTGAEFPLVAAVAFPGSQEAEYVDQFLLSGYCFSSAKEHARDLVNVPEKRVYERWVNVYGPRESYEYTSPALADADACTGRIACIHIKQEYVEGEGL